VSGSWPTRSSRSSPTLSTSRLATLVLLTTAACALVAQTSTPLEPSSSRDRKIVRRWSLPEKPHGVAIGADGTIYVGLAETQAVVAINPKEGAIRRRVILDSAEIASTKELVTLRMNADKTRLFIANGSDESASILSLPDLGILREITMEGETIRDVIPDPRGRYVYLLGRRIHVFDAEGDTEVRTISIADPMAMAVSTNGSLLAVLATEDYGNTKATSVTLFDTTSFAEVAREPLQTDKAIEAAMFAAGDRSIIAFSRDSMFEKRITLRPTRVTSANAGKSSMRVDIGELVNSTHVCLPDRSGPQIAALSGNDALIVYAERRCSASGTFSGSNSGVTPASLYGINAYALAYDKASNTLAVTDRDGFLTIYNVPRPAQTN
jgi:hypothetical protein